MLRYLTAPILEPSIIEWKNYIYGKHGFFMASNGRVLLMAPSPEAPQTPGRYFNKQLKPVGILSPFPDCFELKERFDFNLGPVVHGFTGSPCSGLTYAHNVAFQQKYVDMALGRLHRARDHLHGRLEVGRRGDAVPHRLGQ